MPEHPVEELIIRLGGDKGPRNPSIADVTELMKRIETGECSRPEFTIESVSKRVWMSVARFSPGVQEEARGWLVIFAEENKARFALSGAGQDKGQFIEGTCCGGPLTMKAICNVESGIALEAIEYFLTQRNRSPKHSWVEESKVYSFD
jgi:hypothetical protein